MRILLDTHFLIWLATDPSELSTIENKLLSAPEHECLLSTTSIWELRVKSSAMVRRGGPSPPLLPSDAIRFAALNDLAILSPALDDFAVPLNPPLAHSDPFDEMLLVHAQQLGARLLTRDGKLIDHALAALPV